MTGGSPDREVRGQSFMCYPRGTQGIQIFLSGFPTGRTSDRGHRKEFYVQKFYVPFLLPKEKKKNPHAHKNKIGKSTPPPFQKNPRPPPPLKGGVLWAWGFSNRKKQKMPVAHKIGAAISVPRIAGDKFYRHVDFSENRDP